MLRRHEKNTRVQMAKDSLARHKKTYPEDFEARIIAETKLGTKLLGTWIQEGD